jgi:hypothetical protein
MGPHKEAAFDVDLFERASKSPYQRQDQYRGKFLDSSIFLVTCNLIVVFTEAALFAELLAPL